MPLSHTSREQLALSIHTVRSTELTRYVPDLTDLLVDTVDHGAPMGFVAPMSYDDALTYWLSLKPELNDGSRVLLVVCRNDRVVATGQLELAGWPNARHRAEVQKLIVSRALRGQGVGRRLMAALHDAARARGRTLLILGAYRGAPAEQFYRSLGYSEIGVIPGYAIDASGHRYDNVRFYLALE
jgi:ribosomal protein S18 acetylase RimI-like enzyme